MSHPLLDPPRQAPASGQPSHATGLVLHPPVLHPPVSHPPVSHPPVPPDRPHTTHAKVSLYLVLAPALEGLAGELTALNLKRPGLAAEPQAVAQAAALLRECRHLLRGEPGARLAGLDFTPPIGVQALALGLRQLVAAVSGFRDRYYGYDARAGGPAWAVAFPDGSPDPRWLGRPHSIDPNIGELNLMSAELMRTHLHDLARRRGVALPPELRRPEEPDTTPPPRPFSSLMPLKDAPPPVIRRNPSRRYDRSTAARRRRSKQPPRG